ncbi:MAG: hypothetical protein HY232_01485 [Acidobacteria bacterium]|nr:hypothetical protein [Acidobacteriota bacterium]
MIGIIQEQHPDRCRLFMQWQRMDWPILIDSLNLTGVAVVPLTYAIDEHGIVRFVKPSLENIEDFLSQSYPQPYARPEAPVRIPYIDPLKPETHSGTAASWRTYGDALFLWAGSPRLNEVIEAYQHALKIDPKDSVSQFRLGVSYRRRYDSERRRPDDFQKAVEHWTRALEMNPNQYIWRRRLQQYGPRLIKPYAFYDWVAEARQEIRARGETPISLPVEPAGAEIATPVKDFDVVSPKREEPDPGGKIMRDTRRFIEIEAVVVPSTIKAGQVARVHIIMRPKAKIKAHWNNEVDPLQLWINPPKGWSVDNRHGTAPHPPQAVSTETREVQFEIRSPEKAPLGKFSVPAYALYYVCEDVDGACLYRRQDIRVSGWIQE